jgi:streptogramin lyase
MSRARNSSRIAFAIGAGLLIVLIAGWSARKAAAKASPAEPASTLAGTMLTGTIRAANGKPLEGVAVSVREVEKTFTTSVFTDGGGNYFFPVLDKGQYRVWAQAVGYEAGRAELSLDPNKEIRQDFTLRTLDDFTMQLSGAEWMAALPSDTPQNRRLKEIFQYNCAACHTQGFVLQNRFDKEGWLAILTSMELARNSSGVPWPNIHHFKEELADYLAKMRGPGPSPMQFHPLPRPTADAARAVITEYDIPPAQTPNQLAAEDGSDWSEGTASTYWNGGTHDVAIDFFGNAWVSSSADNQNRSYAKIDTKTGKITNYKVPLKNGWARTTHGVSTGPDGMIWYTFTALAGGARRGIGAGAGEKGTSSTAQNVPGGSLGSLNPRTEKLDLFDAPEGMTPVTPVGGHVDVDGKGKVWVVTRKGGLCFDPETGKFADFISLSVDNPKFSTYGLAADADGNGWWAILTEDKLGLSDIKTGKSREVQFAPRSEMKEFTTEEDRKFYDRKDNLGPLSNNTSAPWLRTPRRLAGDHTGRLMWAADFYGKDIASVDIRTLQVSYYDLPIPYASAYDVEVDNNHVVWASLRNADRVGKFDPKTKKWTVYKLPTLGTECRNIAVDQKTGDVWLPSFRTSKAIRLQFRTEQQLAAVQAKMISTTGK